MVEEYAPKLKAIADGRKTVKDFIADEVKGKHQRQESFCVFSVNCWRGWSGHIEGKVVRGKRGDL